MPGQGSVVGELTLFHSNLQTRVLGWGELSHILSGPDLARHGVIQGHRLVELGL